MKLTNFILTAIALALFACTTFLRADDVLIVDGPIVKKHYPGDNSNILKGYTKAMLKDSKGRIWLSSTATFGYLDENDNWYNFRNVTDSSWLVPLPLIGSNINFQRLKEDKYGNIIANNISGVGRFDGENWQTILARQYPYMDWVHADMLGDTIYGLRFQQELFKFPYDSATNTYTPIEEKYPELFETSPNAMLFPYANSVYFDGKHYALGISFVSDTTILYLVHRHKTETGDVSVVGWIEYYPNQGKWDDSIQMATDMLKYLWDGPRFVVQTNNGNCIFGYLTDSSIIHPDLPNRYGRRPAIYTATVKCIYHNIPSSPFDETSSFLMLDDDNFLFYSCGDILHYTQSKNELKHIPMPQEVRDIYGDDEYAEWVYENFACTYMLRTDTNEVWLSTYSGIYVCDLNALLGSGCLVSIEETERLRIPDLAFRNLYPNPTTQRIVNANIMCYVEDLSRISIGLYNLDGVKLLDLSDAFEYNHSDKTIFVTFEVPSEIAAGMYYLNVNNGSEHRTEPIVVK